MATSTPVVTATVLETSVIMVDPSIFTSCATITQQYHTTISATRGQTIFISPPSSATTLTAVPTTKIYPTLQAATTSTTTVTEVEIYLQTSGSVYSTWKIPLSSQLPPRVTSPYGQLVYVVDPAASGWDSWSTGAKAGLIVGVVLGAILLILGLILCLKRRNDWIAHDWRWARTVENPGARNIVPTVQVPGPLNPQYATPYGYGHPGWGYMRGGSGGDDGIKDKLFGRFRPWNKESYEAQDDINCRPPADTAPVSGQERYSRGGQARRHYSPLAQKQIPAFYRPPVTERISRESV